MRFLITILCLISSLLLAAQKNHRAIELDHLGHIYSINENELKKYTAEGKMISNYSDALLGEITTIDVSNPLRLLIFYKESNLVVYLDQNLSPINDPIDLYTYSDNETLLCCNASSGGFWIYNPEDNQTFNISKQGEIRNKSLLLDAYFKNKQPSKMIEYHDALYFLIPSQGILILNKFGQFEQHVLLPGITDFCFDNQTLFYQKNRTWLKYNPLLQIDTLIFEQKGTNDCQSKIRADKIYIFCRDQISIKTLNH